MVTLGYSIPDFLFLSGTRECVYRMCTRSVKFHSILFYMQLYILL